MNRNIHKVLVRFSARLLIITLLFVFTSCADWNSNEESEKQPNILWIYLEDTNPLFGCYDFPLSQTPNIDKLAEDGVRFTNVFMPVPVCSPCRSGIICGMMPTSIGVQNHHSSRTEESAIYLPENIQTIPELFKEAGYFTFNNGKDDYNFMYNRFDLYDQSYYKHPLYGKSGERIDLAVLKEKQPFFGQIQMYGGKEIFSSKFKDRVKNPVDRSKIVLPPYLPNDTVIIEEYANHIDAIQITDNRFGEIMEKLKDGGILVNTIIFFFSDHGMRLTRHKQFLYDGGTHVPLIIARYKDGMPVEKGIVQDDLISGLDIGTTSLALAGLQIPEYMEGVDIFDKDFKGRDWVISSRDRCDFSIDRIRSVRSKEFKYIRNYMTDRPYMQKSYMDVDRVPFVIRMKELYNENKLNEVQARFMAEDRPAEEFYDIINDPFEINNLAGDVVYADFLKQYRDILENWIKETGDMGQSTENAEGLKFMLGVWGDHVENPEYTPLVEAFPDLGGSLFHMKSAEWKKFENNEN
nr:sulfatase [Bacteroidota bacterium]